MDCNHIIGMTNPRHSSPTLRKLSDGVKGWRGTVFFYCPKCGIKQWEWVRDPNGTGGYIKKYIGREK